MLASSNGMCTQFVVAKTASGARNIGHAPTQKAMPNVAITSPRYIGLRVKRKGPRVTSRLTGGPQAQQRLEVCSTVGDGSCGIHAMLGVVNPLTGQYEHANTADVRRQIAARIRAGLANAGRYRAMITDLLRGIYRKRVLHQVLSADEQLLWAEFEKIEGLADRLNAVYQEETRRYGLLTNRRNAIIEGYLAIIKSDNVAYTPLRRFLVGEILRSNAASDAEARQQLEALEGADNRDNALRAMPDIYLRGVIEVNLQGLAKRWRSNTDLWWEYGRYRGAAHRTDLAMRAQYTRVVTDFSANLLNAYATVVENNAYYLREEDLRELADIQQRGLNIYREDDRNRGSFIQQVTHPGPNPFQVYHSGAHYERAQFQ